MIKGLDFREILKDGYLLYLLFYYLFNIFNLFYSSRPYLTLSYLVNKEPGNVNIM